MHSVASSTQHGEKRKYPAKPSFHSSAVPGIFWTSNIVDEPRVSEFSVASDDESNTPDTVPKDPEPLAPPHKKRGQNELNEEESKIINMQDLPAHLVQYQLLTFCLTESTVKLAKASRQLFSTLKHNIRRTDVIISSFRFVEQSPRKCTQIGIFSSVRVTTLQQLTSLITLIAERKLDSPLLCLEIDLKEPLGKIVFSPDGYHFNQSLKEITLPSSFHTLTFGFYFNQSLKEITLPPCLHTLNFGLYFNQSLDQVSLPQTLHTLTFGFYFNESMDKVTLPPALHTLTFGFRFNQALDQVTLPPTLHTLTLGDKFNQSLDQVTLPPALHTLIFGFCFNQSLDQVTLPPTLHTLTFGSDFNQSLSKIKLPDPTSVN